MYFLIHNCNNREHEEEKYENYKSGKAIYLNFIEDEEHFNDEENKENKYYSIKFLPSSIFQGGLGTKFSRVSFWY